MNTPEIYIKHLEGSVFGVFTPSGECRYAGYLNNCCLYMDVVFYGMDGAVPLEFEGLPFIGE